VAQPNSPSLVTSPTAKHATAVIAGIHSR
jgi:hypothetical protein